jgi:hypothetical protein
MDSLLGSFKREKNTLNEEEAKRFLETKRKELYGLSPERRVELLGGVKIPKREVKFKSVLQGSRHFCVIDHKNEDEFPFYGTLHSDGLKIHEALQKWVNPSNVLTGPVDSLQGADVGIKIDDLLGDIKTDSVRRLSTEEIESIEQNHDYAFHLLKEIKKGGDESVRLFSKWLTQQDVRLRNAFTKHLSREIHKDEIFFRKILVCSLIGVMSSLGLNAVSGLYQILLGIVFVVSTLMFVVLLGTFLGLKENRFWYKVLSEHYPQE